MQNTSYFIVYGIYNTMFMMKARTTPLCGFQHTVGRCSSHCQHIWILTKTRIWQSSYCESFLTLKRIIMHHFTPRRTVSSRSTSSSSAASHLISSCVMSYIYSGWLIHALMQYAGIDNQRTVVVLGQAVTYAPLIIIHTAILLLLQTVEWCT